MIARKMVQAHVDGVLADVLGVIVTGAPNEFAFAFDAEIADEIFGSVLEAGADAEGNSLAFEVRVLGRGSLLDLVAA